MAQLLLRHLGAPFRTAADELVYGVPETEPEVQSASILCMHMCAQLYDACMQCLPYRV